MNLLDLDSNIFVNYELPEELQGKACVPLYVGVIFYIENSKICFMDVYVEHEGLMNEAIIGAFNSVSLQEEDSSIGIQNTSWSSVGDRRFYYSSDRFIIEGVHYINKKSDYPDSNGRYRGFNRIYVQKLVPKDSPIVLGGFNIINVAAWGASILDNGPAEANQTTTIQLSYPWGVTGTFSLGDLMRVDIVLIAPRNTNYDFMLVTSLGMQAWTLDEIRGSTWIKYAQDSTTYESYVHVEVTTGIMDIDGGGVIYTKDIITESKYLGKLSGN
jgi:hypothetical protein